jgi:dienelactone hydrolase
MPFIISILSTLIIQLVTLSAQAAPSQEVLSLIQKTYDPAFSVAALPATLNGTCSETSLILTAQDPVTLMPAKIQLKMYVPILEIKHPEQARTIILMPPTGGENAIDRAYASLFCKEGFRVALVQHWEGDQEIVLDMKMHDRGALRALTAVRHSIEYLNVKNPSQLGILGTSVGGISAALILGYEPRITTAVLIVSGGGMPEIISQSQVTSLLQLKADRFKAFGFTDDEQYRKALGQNIKFEPLDFVGLSGQKNVLMVIAQKDHLVPTSAQLKLEQAFGNPQVLYVNSDHAQAIVTTFLFQKSKLLNFFKEHVK